MSVSTVTPRRVVSASGARGFSLLEIMVVVLLIGLTVTLVSLSLQHDADRLAELEARRFVALLEHVREESILTGRAIGIEVDEAEGRLRFLAPGEAWSPIEQDDVLHPRRFAETVTVRLDLLEQDAAGADVASPRVIVVEAVGEISPFVLTLVGDADAFVVSMDEDQNLAIERRDAELG